MLRTSRIALSLCLILLLCATSLPGLIPPIIPGGTVPEIVYDPFNEVHFIAEVSLLASQYQQLILTYKQILYNATYLGNKQAWILPLPSWIPTTAPDTYGINRPWVNAANTGWGVPFAYATSTAPLNTYNLATIPPPFYPRIEQQYAAVQLIDGTTQQALQTVGQYKGDESQRAQAIRSLGATIGSSSNQSNSEVVTLGTISTANYLALQEAHDANAINASLLEQQLQEQNQRRQALAYAINSDIQFRQDEPAAYAAHNTNTTAALQNLAIP